MKQFFILLPLFFLFSLCIAQTDSSQGVKKNELLQPGKPKVNISEYINKCLSHENRMRISREEIKGKAFIEIQVDKYGKVKNVQVLKGIDPAIDKELIELLKFLEWKPAITNGVPVNARYTVPIEIK